MIGLEKLIVCGEVEKRDIEYFFNFVWISNPHLKVEFRKLKGEVISAYFESCMKQVYYQGRDWGREAYFLR